MLRSLKELENDEIGATDGHIGQVKDVYFDDRAWVVRYLVVETGTWLDSRKVLISPISMQKPNRAEHLLPVSITRAQVKDSPSIDTDKPVSRQNEIDYLGYYGYPYYWGGSGIWADTMYPYSMLPGHPGGGLLRDERDDVESEYERAERAGHAHDDPHLRSGREVVGYHIEAKDGEIGHVEGLIVDDETWALRYIVVNTGNWWLGHKVLVAPAWIQHVRWLDRTVSIALSRDALKAAPPYDSTAALNREREARLYEHHGLPGYWTDKRLRDGEYER